MAWKTCWQQYHDAELTNLPVCGFKGLMVMGILEVKGWLGRGNWLG